MRNRIKTALAGGAAALALSAPAHANITGSVDATITLTAGCIINGQNLDDGNATADFGTLDFGTHNTLFGQADSEVLSGGGAIEIQCSPGVAPLLSFNAGENDGEGAGEGARAMAHGSVAGQYVTYNLYRDAARTDVIAIGDGVALTDTGAQQTIQVYGRAFGENGLITGVYGDTITVVLEL
ncbi:MAG TPA: spore coat U domain-containing protein [Sphingopyxis sp.]|nr:spore coat U domain-containing protein [Sphingopyxis sp.]HMP43858.1 spore coat U domain-containing protein [Sphingopyxis sp.]HMQ19692.1 spore coat U domain-containing protein [Sphingopyxis sp.]